MRHMSTITLKNIPVRVHERLKVRAALHHRSLNGEILECLRQMAEATPLHDAEYWLEFARRVRANSKPVKITHAEFNRFKRMGRA